MLPRLISLAALLGHPRARHVLVACSLFTGLVLAAAMTWHVLASRQGVIDDAVREMRNDALMLAEDEDRLLQAVDVVQLGLIEHMRAIGIDSPETFAQLMTSQAVHQNLSDRVAGLSYISALLLFDPHGVLLNFSRVWPPPVNGADRGFIRDMTAVGAPQTFISEPSRSKITGQWVIYRGRRFQAADGRLIGFVVSTIQIAYFEQFYARLPLSGGGAFSLFRRDGTLMARYPHVDPKIGSTFAETMNFNRIVGSLDGGVVRQTSILDGEDRLIVPHTIAHFPLFVAVSDTMTSILRAWTGEIRILIAATILLELAIAGTMLLAVRHLRSHERLQAAETARARAEAGLSLAQERERAAHLLHMQEMRFDVALSNMLQGLAMCDSTGRVLIVNRRFIELFGLPTNVAQSVASFAEMMDLAVGCGTITQDDLAALRAWRGPALVNRARAIFAWELADGRTLTVTHQPMPDGWLTTFEDITERRRADVRMAYMARHDALTDLPNRMLFREKLEAALAHARRGRPLALLCLDLDQFKAVNDTLGHPVGDALLQAVAGRLTEHTRDTDTVARLGGDEFAVVQAPIDKATEAADFAERLIVMFDEPFEVLGHQIVIGTSIGIAFAPQDGLDADQLLKNADLALYRAKSDGRGVYRLFHSAMDVEMQARRRVELDLRHALRSGQFELVYQPLIDLRAQAVSGFEALVRWRHPERGMVQPAQFIPLAEEIGAIVPIGEWVLRQACAAAVTWSGELRVSVNLSAVQFKSRDLVATVAAALRDARLAPGRLELEITESIMLQDTEATLATLHELRSIGIRIAMDDFGTGYSSLSYLRRFPFDRIKIDQSFVRELGKQRDCGAIIRAVIALSHDLGMAVTAEGVETREQLCALALAGCSDIQGYLFSQPVPLGDIPAMLRSMPMVADLLRQVALVA